MRLQVLELDHVSEITQEVAAEVCREGLKGLEMLVLTATPVTPKALLHFNSEPWGLGGGCTGTAATLAWALVCALPPLPAEAGVALGVPPASGLNNSAQQKCVALCAAHISDMACSIPSMSLGHAAQVE